MKGLATLESCDALLLSIKISFFYWPQKAWIEKICRFEGMAPLTWSDQRIVSHCSTPVTISTVDASQTPAAWSVRARFLLSVPERPQFQIQKIYLAFVVFFRYASTLFICVFSTPSMGNFLTFGSFEKIKWNGSPVLAVEKCCSLVLSRLGWI